MTAARLHCIVHRWLLPKLKYHNPLTDCNKMCSSYPAAPIEGKNSSSFNTYCVDLHKMYHKKNQNSEEFWQFWCQFFSPFVFVWKITSPPPINNLLYPISTLHYPLMSITSLILALSTAVPVVFLLFLDVKLLITRKVLQTCIKKNKCLTFYALHSDFRYPLYFYLLLFKYNMYYVLVPPCLQDR